MKRIVYLATVFVLWGFSQSAKAQFMDSIMDAHASIFPKEKMHIHFDKQLYNKEETIFYKLYLLMEQMPSPASRNVYVDWYDVNGKMLRQTVAPLFQSTAKGSFDIPANYAGEFIRVKAYTRWMLNDDTSFIYQKDIQINNGKLPAKKVTVIRTRVEVFPEGGNLVQGLTEKVAFKATNQ
ncbi:MAG: hypothetical protein ACK4S0_08975, partial [Sediminibacterium sp.]